ASLVGDQGEGVPGAKISFDVDGARYEAVACGPGCYRTTASAGAPKRVVVRVVHEDGSVTTWPVTVPRPWPPPDASSIVARPTRAPKGAEGRGGPRPGARRPRGGGSPGAGRRGPEPASRTR